MAHTTTTTPNSPTLPKSIAFLTKHTITTPRTTRTTKTTKTTTSFPLTPSSLLADLQALLAYQHLPTLPLSAHPDFNADFAAAFLRHWPGSAEDCAAALEHGVVSGFHMAGCDGLGVVIDQAAAEKLHAERTKAVFSCMGKASGTAWADLRVRFKKLLVDELKAAGLPVDTKKVLSVVEQTLMLVRAAEEPSHPVQVLEGERSYRDFEVQVLRLVDGRGGTTVQSSFHFPFADSFGGFLAALRDETVLCRKVKERDGDGSGFTLVDGVWKYTMLNLEGRVGNDFRNLGSEEEYLEMLDRLRPLGVGVGVVVIHSVELAVMETDFNKYHAEEEEAEQYRLSLLDEDGSPFFDEGSYLDMLSREDHEMTG